MIEFTRLFPIRINSVKTCFLLYYCTKNTSQQQIPRIKNPLLLKKLFKFSKGMDFNLTKWTLLFQSTFEKTNAKTSIAKINSTTWAIENLLFRLSYILTGAARFLKPSVKPGKRIFLHFYVKLMAVIIKMIPVLAFLMHADEFVLDDSASLFHSLHTE